jgi:hypothetical protein
LCCLFLQFASFHLCCLFLQFASFHFPFNFNSITSYPTSGTSHDSVRATSANQKFILRNRYLSLAGNVNPVLVNL